MKIKTLVTITDSKDNTDLYSLFCGAARGEYADKLKSHKSYAADLEVTLSNAFDKFAQSMFEAGMKHQKELDNKS